MDSFGEYLREQRENIGLPLRKVAADLDIDTSILSKIERNERESEFERLYDPNHPVRNNLETLDSMEEVRIINETLK